MKKIFLNIVIALFLSVNLQAIDRYEVNSDYFVTTKSLLWAMEQVGKTEKTGHNDGPFVKYVLGTVNLRVGNPWCQAFVYASEYTAAKELREIGYNGVISIPKTGHANTVAFSYSV